MARAPYPSVLLVEPHTDTRDMYAEYLQQAGWHVLTATLAADVQALAPAVDVIVTEIRLSSPTDGLDAVRRLRAAAATRRLPIVVLTTSSVPARRSEAHAAGCDVFLIKPCQPALLVEELRRLVGRRASGHPPRLRPRRRSV